MDQATHIAFADDRKARRNVFVLSAAGALGGALATIVFATAPIAAYNFLGDDKSWATAPITAFVIGQASGTVPAALLMRRIGRRPGFIAGVLIGGVGLAIGAQALATESFLLLAVCAFLVGFSGAFVQQFRFAAADAVSPAFRARAISLVMVGGIVAAIIGPQTVIHMSDLLAPIPFAGAYVAGAGLAVLGALVLLLLDIPRVEIKAGHSSGRPLREIARQPDFIIAVACAALAFAIMNFVMTAAPLAMVLHHHHQNDAVLGIQWHVLAMFVPSFVTGSLIARFGAKRVVAMGMLLLIGCAVAGMAGTSVGHFWAGLILLGVGWNFAFIGGTTLVTRTYRPEEKEKVQALNDFIIFAIVALSSFSSGEMLLYGGWWALNVAVIPIALVALGALFWDRHRRLA